MIAWGLAVLVLLRADALASASCVGAPWDRPDQGVVWGALFLMGVPVAMAGILGGWLFHDSRHAQGEGVTGRFAWTQFLGTKKESEE